MHSTERAALKDAFMVDFREAWRQLRAGHANERFYGFGLYTTDTASYLTVTASTEEGLAQVTASYVEKHGGGPELQRTSLRWSPCDSPLHGEGEEKQYECQRLEGRQILEP